MSGCMRARLHVDMLIAWLVSIQNVHEGCTHEDTRMRHKFLWTAMLAAISTTAVADTQDSDSTTTFDPVVVTATRVEQPVTEVLAPVTVITRAEIVRLQPLTVRDLLAGLPGIVLANSGGIGQQTSLFMRGTGSAHTLVLIDGVRIGAVGAGIAQLAQIPVDQIERIEIVRGPRSSVYGADAIGGVIQIFTRHGSPGEGVTPSFHISGGSNNTWNSHVGLSGGSERGWFNVSLGAEYTHGINSCRLGAGTVFAGCFANEPDDDGYRAYSAVLNGGWRWDSGAQLTGNFLRTTSFVEYDGSFYNYSRHAQQVMGVSLEVPATESWTMTFNAGRSQDKATNYHDGAYVDYRDSTRDQLSWLNTIELAAGQTLVVGVDYGKQSIDSTTDYAVIDSENTGVFAQYLGHFGASELQLSLRRDDNQQFGGHNTGAIAWGYHFGNDLTFSVSYATAFHAPTFNDLYWPAFPGFPPPSNPHLQPEESENIEVDLGARHQGWYWQLSAYRNQIDNLIVLDSDFTPGNLSSAEIRGFEAAAGGRLGKWVWAGYLTLQSPENADGGPHDGNLLPRRFERSARIDLDRRFGEFSVGTTVKGFSERYDDLANSHRLGGYALVDLRASWQFATHWKAQVSVDNVFDRQYETVYYYNQPGRTGMLTLRYTP